MSMKTQGFRISAIVVVLLLAALVVTAGLRSRRAPPAVLLVTIDTLRADALGAIGGGAHTPEFDRLAAEGVLFDDAVSVSPTTGPSHASILSGQFPWRHGYRNNGQMLSATTPMLASVLGRAGYRSGGFVSGFPLNRMFGFDRGFDHYDDTVDAVAGNPQAAANERSAEHTTRAAMAWLGEITEPRWFAWVHYYDPHAPYRAPAAFQQTGEHADYAAEVAYVDYWLGELVRAARAVNPNVIIVVTSDHGEGLGDHGEQDHGLLLYQSTLRVPLLIVAPGVAVPALRPRLAARSVDIVPTVLALLGVAPVTADDGIDLGPALRGDSLAIPPAYSESYYGSLTYGWAPLRSLRDGDAKRIEGARSRYYDLAADPAERQPLASDNVDARLESLLASTPEPVATLAAPDATANDAMQRLRSLGYLGAGASTDQRRWDVNIDPEDRLPEHSQLWNAQVLLDRGDVHLADARYRAIAELSPDNRVAWLRIGAIAMAQRRIDEASLAFQHAVDLDPLNPEAQLQLASTLTAQRRYRDAAYHWAEVTRLQPTRAVAWSNLGTVLFMDGKGDASAAALTEAVRLSPDSADLLENLARVHIRNGQAGEAMTMLRDLKQRQGNQFRLGAVLAQQFVAQGDAVAAEDALADSRSTDDGYVEAHVALARHWLELDIERARRHVIDARAAAPARADALIAADGALATKLPLR